MVSANTTCLVTRSTRARTRSPGIAPATSTIWPSWRASMRPPLTGFSMVRVISVPGARDITNWQFAIDDCLHAIGNCHQ